jgi:hypothetical protein
MAEKTESDEGMQEIPTVDWLDLRHRSRESFCEICDSRCLNAVFWC